MTNVMKKAIVACLVVTTLGLTAAPVVAAGVQEYRTARLEAYSTHEWRMTTTYGSFEVVLQGDGDTDLDVFVYDAVTGRFLGSDTRSTDFARVRGFSDSGRLLIRVRNLGDVWNRYNMRVD